MTNTEQFTEAQRIWSETLTPQTPVERRLVTFIACQDWLLSQATLRALVSNQDPGKAIQHGQRQCQLIDSIGHLIEAVTTLQKRRSASEAPPPQPPSAKVLEMPKRRRNKTTAAPFGRPRAVRFNLDPMPVQDPFSSVDPREPGLRHSLELQSVA